MDTYVEWAHLHQEMVVMVEVDNEWLKELIETGRQIRKELDEFNENLDILIEAVTVAECDWVDWERSKQTTKQRWISPIYTNMMLLLCKYTGRMS